MELTGVRGHLLDVCAAPVAAGESVIAAPDSLLRLFEDSLPSPMHGRADSACRQDRIPTDVD